MRNTYIDEVVKNNSKIKEVLDNNFSFIDPVDISIFSLFYEHYIRYNVENDANKRLSTPLRIYNHIGNISFLRPEFIEKVKLRFHEKKRELADLVSK